MAESLTRVLVRGGGKSGLSLFLSLRERETLPPKSKSGRMEGRERKRGEERRGEERERIRWREKYKEEIQTKKTRQYKD